MSVSVFFQELYERRVARHNRHRISINRYTIPPTACAGVAPSVMESQMQGVPFILPLARSDSKALSGLNDPETGACLSIYWDYKRIWYTDPLLWLIRSLRKASPPNVPL